MFVLLKGYNYCSKILFSNKYCRIKYAKHVNLSFLKKSSLKQITRLFSSPTVVLPVDNEGAKKLFVPFDKMLDERRTQAKKSILVQVHSEKSCAQLYDYCLKYGDIENMIHYSQQTNSHFVIVEFVDEKSARDVIFKSAHMENSQIIPVRSQFLWFKANDNVKSKSKTDSELYSVPFSTFGSICCPKQSEINSWLLASKDVSEQIVMLFKATHLDDLGTRMRFIAAYQIESTLAGMFPHVRAIPFGSTVNGFGKLGCDLDVVVRLDHQLEENTKDSRLVYHTKTSLVSGRTQQQRYIESIAELIERYLPGCSGVKRILQARVPILKYKQEFTGIECDLSLTNMTGVYMAELLHIYGSFDARVRPLVYAIRYWAETVSLTNPAPGRWITNFSLTLLTLFYLQNVKVIPTFNEIIKLARPEDKRFAEDVNCTFLRDINSLLENPVMNDASLSELLKGFYDFYTFFDFDSQAISLRTGKTLPKQEHSALYIVNPLESHLNVSKNVSPEELGRMKIEICNAARYLDREFNANVGIPSEENEWGLVTLFQWPHLSSKGRNMIYSSVQQKQPSISTNRLVTITELFEDDELNKSEKIVNQIFSDESKKQKQKTVYYNEKNKTRT